MSAANRMGSSVRVFQPYDIPHLNADQDFSAAIENRQEIQDTIDRFSGGDKATLIGIPRLPHDLSLGGFPTDRPLRQKGNCFLGGHTYQTTGLSGIFFGGPLTIFGAIQGAVPTSAPLEPNADLSLRFDFATQQSWYNLSEIGFCPRDRETIGMEMHLHRRAAADVGQANTIVSIMGRILGTVTEAFAIVRNGDKFEFRFRTDTGETATLTSTTTIALNGNYEVAWSYDANAGADNLILLVDGTVQDTATLTGNFSARWYECAYLGAARAWINSEGLFVSEDWDVGSFRFTADARRTANYTPDGLAYDVINDCLCGWDGTTDPDLPVDSMRFFSAGRYAYLMRGFQGATGFVQSAHNGVQDMTLSGSGEATSIGVKTWASIHSHVERMSISGMGPFGIFFDNNSFEATIRDVYLLSGASESLAGTASKCGVIVTNASGVTVIHDFDSIVGWQCAASLNGGLNGGFMYAGQISRVGFFFQSPQGVLEGFGVAEEDSPYALEYGHLIEMAGQNPAVIVELFDLLAEVPTYSTTVPIAFFGGFDVADRIVIHSGTIAPHPDAAEIIKILNPDTKQPNTLQLGAAFTWRNKDTVPLTTTANGAVYYTAADPWRTYEATLAAGATPSPAMLKIPFARDSFTTVTINAKGIDQTNGDIYRMRAKYEFDRPRFDDVTLLGGEPTPEILVNESTDWDITHAETDDYTEFSITSDPDNEVTWRVEAGTQTMPRGTGIAPTVTAVSEILAGSQFLYLSATHVTLVGGKVSVVFDLGSEGFNAAQATASKRPTWIENWFNGLPALDFDPAFLQEMAGTGTTIDDGNGWGLFIIGAKDNDPDTVDYLDPWFGGAGTGQALTAKSGAKYVMTAVANTSTTGPFGCGTAPGYFSWNNATETGTPDCKVNGVAIDSSGARPDGGAIAGYTIGFVAANWADLKLHAAVLKNGSYTGPELAQLEAWAVNILGY